MTISNPFVRNKEDYVRNINILKDTIEAHAQYLSLQTGKSYQYCLDYVKEQFRPFGKFEFKDPTITYLERNQYGDRELKQGTLLDYITYSINNKHLIAPTFTTYLNPNEVESYLTGYVEANIAERNKAKKEMFAAKMAGNKRLQLFKKNQQQCKKIRNNAISGAHVSSSTPIYNKTAHPTLTSNCRSTSSFANANNEKLLSGNRHYHHPTVVFNNVIAIINSVNLEQFDTILKKYQLHYPTADELYKCLTRSCFLYWRSKVNEERLLLLCKNMTPLQRAAVMYVGDLYHLKEYNSDFIKGFISKICEREDILHPNPDEVFSTYRQEYVPLVLQLYADKVRGKSLHDLKGQDIYAILAHNIVKIHNHLIEHRDFIEQIFVTDVVPSSIAYIPNSVRRTVLASDTDSTIFTVADWVKWYADTYEVNDYTNAISAAVVFLAAESITHILAIMSANFGIINRRIHQVAMKNEFKFDVFIPTMVGKHYMALISSQEGNVYKDYEQEIKGVMLKSSNVPVRVMEQANDMMGRLMRLAIKAKPFSILPFLKEVADLERNIHSRILAGDKEFFKMGQIKTASSYKKSETESPYQHYTFWNEVFGSVYGMAPTPPYNCYKVSISLNTKKEISTWIDGVKNPIIKERLQNWNAKNNKSTMSTVYIPGSIITDKGIPVEFHNTLDIRRMILDSTNVFYVMFEAFGLHLLNSRITRLLMDEYV